MFHAFGYTVASIKIRMMLRKSKREITFYFKTSLNILSRKNKDIKVNYIISQYKAQTYFDKVIRIII